jgi:hypothetical protein
LGLSGVRPAAASVDVRARTGRLFVVVGFSDDSRFVEKIVEMSE